MSTPIVPRAEEAVRFAWTSRVLHWLMALLLVAMLFIGAAMAARGGNI